MLNQELELVDKGRPSVQSSAQFFPSKNRELPEMSLNGPLEELNGSLDTDRATILSVMSKYQDAILDESNSSLLHWAAYSGNTTAIEIALQLKPDDVNLENAHGKTPLHFAINNSNQQQKTLYENILL